MKCRVWDSFKDSNEQAQAHGEEVYQTLGSAIGAEHLDMADIAEIARDESAEFSMLLYELERDLTLASVAALYHQWEKDLKQFLSRELRLNGFKPNEVWKKSRAKDILGWMEERGWPLRSYDWFPVLDACRLIVNVHKHGEGWSLDKLKKSYPQYLGFPGDSRTDNGAQDLTHLNHEFLHVTEEHFDQFVGAVKRFWGDFPSEVYLEEH